MQITHHKRIEKPTEVDDAGVVDPRRIDAGFGGVINYYRDALTLLKGCWITIIDVPQFNSALGEADAEWTGWSHAGNHELVGEKLWHWLHCIHGEKMSGLVFSDEPDFHYHLERDQHKARVYGDIGQVSGDTFLRSVSTMWNRKNDMWLSILNKGKQHVLIERTWTLPSIMDRGE